MKRLKIIFSMVFIAFALLSTASMAQTRVIISTGIVSPYGFPPPGYGYVPQPVYYPPCGGYAPARYYRQPCVHQHHASNNSYYHHNNNGNGYGNGRGNGNRNRGGNHSHHN